MTFYDKLMVRDLIKFGLELTEAYDRFDLKEAYTLTKSLSVNVQQKYLPFARLRLTKAKTSNEYKSTL